ncbi:hypothetical protein HNR46_001607 [Haloferula luteola]|uniref:Uncharacterized protein n=1 Tax=Haloferula luteola TaxID=595692 RepID=A0A840VEX7_9BACT|nr:hypothetical protein [Haloferula luteola]MBB5351371.1 hypothetical protein [Haloferula luteola]
MEWLNLHSSVLDSPEFVGEEPVNQATWLKLQRFCIGQENGGRIESCKDWKDRKWQQLVRVTRREIETDSELWEWDGESLVVLFYPVEKETEVKTNRANGRKGGRPKKKTQPDTPEVTENKPPGFESENPTESQRFEIAETERKGRGREGNEERKGREAAAAARAREAESLVSACPRPDLTMPALEAARKCIKRHDGNHTFDEILEATKAATAAVRRWPENERIAWAPSAEKFFRDDQWRRAPESWESRRAAKVGLNKPATIDVGGRKPQLLNLDD